MFDVLYTLFIFPLVQIIELCFFFVYRVAGRNPGAAVFGVSLAVSVFTLPLYFRAEKWQETEREIQRRMAAKIKKIKAVFSGDEQYMILSTYYRQNHYHPVYALRSSFSLLIQIPFFIAAYSYLSHLDVLQGTPFLFIPDLGAPDGLVSLGGTFSVNILPIAMTAINCLSGTLYTRGFALKEKVQLYLMALIFLILLYPSPSGLVLYWTLNNLFSLVKNILVKTKFTRQAVWGILFVSAACLDVYVLFFHHGDLPNRLLACALFSTIFFLPLLAKVPALAAPLFGGGSVIRDNSGRHWCFFASSLILLVLAGLVIPGSLVASSVEEFSFIEAHASPFPFMFRVFLQASGFFLFWIPGLYFLFSARIQKIFCLIMAVLALGACVNVFLVSENFGFLTNTLIFSEPKSLSAGDPGAYAANLAVLALSAAAALFLVLGGKKTLLFSLQAIVLLSLFGFGILNLVRIQAEFAALQGRRTDSAAIIEESCYRLSRQGKNVVFFMLDAAVSGYVPYIFEEKPDLARIFKDFTWFPNCVSFANHTLAGAPPLYGGYEYTPEAINLRDTVPLAEKHREAYLLLPRLFLDAGYSVTVTDPPFDNYRMSNLSIFSEYPEIHAENVSGKYTSLWLNDHPDITGMNITNLLNANLIRFSFFKTVPLFLRYFIYNDGNWLGTENLRGRRSSKNGLTTTIINDYAFLDLLPRLTSVGGEGDTYTAVYAHLPHDTALLQLPDYVPSDTTDGRTEESTAAGKPLRADFPLANFAHDDRYHVNMASFLLLGKFIEFLKNEGVYDNTRIILVADHGRGSGNYEKNIPLPDGSTLQSYNPLLMFKDFSPGDDRGETARGEKAGPAVDYSFMTNADAVFFALKDIIADPVNPFTNEKLEPDKAEGAKITTIGALSSYRHSRYRYTIHRGQWMAVHSNIFDPANWEILEK
jgi:YidC/Oxa1 family membrane protein insertase